MSLTDDGIHDPLFSEFPPSFWAQLGHKDSATELGPGWRELAYSARSRNQAIRLEDKPVYGTQFHSELNEERLRERLLVYLDDYIGGDHEEFEKIIRGSATVHRCRPVDGEVSGALRVAIRRTNCGGARGLAPNSLRIRGQRTQEIGVQCPSGEGSMKKLILFLTAAVLAAGVMLGFAGESEEATIEDVENRLERAAHERDVLAKLVDDVLWTQRVGDVAVVEKVRIYGPPKWREENPNGIGAGNPVKFYAYLFTPKNFADSGKLPLLVLPHGGVHADFTTYYAHIVRELMAQGYIVVAPEYRGSTGYGKGFYETIDYGGREVDDALAARDWAVENHPRVDKDRVGILGWSHGGLITLMSLFDHPDSYVCGYAGVPVSDLILRMGYLGQDYRDLYEADYHIGEDVESNMAEYKRRSPVWNVDKLTRPVRIHTNPHDEDVNFIEVEHLMQALTAAGQGLRVRGLRRPRRPQLRPPRHPRGLGGAQGDLRLPRALSQTAAAQDQPRSDPGGPRRAVALRASHRRVVAPSQAQRRQDAKRSRRHRKKAAMPTSRRSHGLQSCLRHARPGFGDRKIVGKRAPVAFLK